MITSYTRQIRDESRDVVSQAFSKLELNSEGQKLTTFTVEEMTVRRQTLREMLETCRDHVVRNKTWSPSAMIIDELRDMNRSYGYYFPIEEVQRYSSEHVISHWIPSINSAIRDLGSKIKNLNRGERRKEEESEAIQEEKREDAREEMSPEVVSHRLPMHLLAHEGLE